MNNETPFCLDNWDCTSLPEFSRGTESLSPLSLLTCGMQAVDTGICWSVLESVHLDFALSGTEKRHISLFGSFPSSERSQHSCPVLLCLLALPPGREVLLFGGLTAARATAGCFSHTLRALSETFLNSLLLTPCQGQRGSHVDLAALARAQMPNKEPTSSSIADHGSGTGLFVEFLCYNKRSGQCGNRNSNGLQMENYLMEQLSSKNVILSQSKCLWNCRFTYYFSGEKKKNKTKNNPIYF